MIPSSILCVRKVSDRNFACCLFVGNTFSLCIPFKINHLYFKTNQSLCVNSKRWRENKKTSKLSTEIISCTCENTACDRRGDTADNASWPTRGTRAWRRIHSTDSSVLACWSFEPPSRQDPLSPVSNFRAEHPPLIRRSQRFSNFLPSRSMRAEMFIGWRLVRFRWEMSVVFVQTSSSPFLNKMDRELATLTNL